MHLLCQGKKEYQYVSKETKYLSKRDQVYFKRDLRFISRIEFAFSTWRMAGGVVCACVRFVCVAWCVRVWRVGVLLEGNDVARNRLIRVIYHVHILCSSSKCVAVVNVQQ